MSQVAFSDAPFLVGGVAGGVIPGQYWHHPCDWSKKNKTYDGKSLFFFKKKGCKKALFLFFLQCSCRLQLPTLLFFGFSAFFFLVKKGKGEWWDKKMVKWNESCTHLAGHQCNSSFIKIVWHYWRLSSTRLVTRTKESWNCASVLALQSQQRVAKAKNEKNFFIPQWLSTSIFFCNFSFLFFYFDVWSGPLVSIFSHHHRRRDSTATPPNLDLCRVLVLGERGSRFSPPTPWQSERIAGRAQVQVPER